MQDANIGEWGVMLVGSRSGSCFGLVESAERGVVSYIYFLYFFLSFSFGVFLCSFFLLSFDEFWEKLN